MYPHVILCIVLYRFIFNMFTTLIIQSQVILVKICYVSSRCIWYYSITFHIQHVHNIDLFIINLSMSKLHLTFSCDSSCDCHSSLVADFYLISVFHVQLCNRSMSSLHQFDLLQHICSMLFH